MDNVITMTEEATTNGFLILMRSLKTQIFPLQGHICGLEAVTKLTDVNYEIQFYEQHGDYFMWHCQLCDRPLIIEVAALIQNTENKEKILELDPSQRRNKLLFVSFAELRRLSNFGVSEERLVQMMSTENDCSGK